MLAHTTTIYLHPNFARMAERLASKMPPGLDVTYFTNSGSEANDLAILLARAYTGQQRRDRGAERLPRRLPGDDGRAPATTPGSTPSSSTAACTTPSARTPTAAPSAARRQEIASQERRRHPGADPLLDAGQDRGVHRRADPGRGRRRPAARPTTSRRPTPSPGRTAACASPTRSRPASAGPASTTGASRTSASCRTSSRWPRASATARRSPRSPPGARSPRSSTQRIHFNTFGGNPVSMAAGLAVLEAIDEDGLQENARVVGGRFKQRTRGAACGATG